MNHKLNEPLIQVILEPMGSRLRVKPGLSLLECAQLAGVEINAVCGGNGTCGMCKVIALQGQFSPLDQTERDLLEPAELGQGVRLACQARVTSDALVQFPPESLATFQRLQLESQALDILPEPTVSWKDLELPQEVGPAQLATWLENQFQIEVSPGLLAALSKPLPKNMRIVYNCRQVIAILPGGSLVFGLAVDIGTTKIAGYLVDLESGRTVASSGITNPQIAFGEDVISRIEFSDRHPQGGLDLQRVLVGGLNELVATLCSQAGIQPGQVVDAVMVGNTAMHHLLVGCSVHSLGTSPYQAAILEAIQISASQIGLHLAPGAQVYLPPNIAGFVGGDHVAMLLATRAAEYTRTVVALDIGTNTEISLIHQGRHLACSCASGPAFEGAHIREGIRAIPGAIERIRLEENSVQVHTIQGRPPIGICGSGILDAVAELRRMDLIDRRGVFRKGTGRLSLHSGKPAFILVPAEKAGHQREISINRQDINEIQLAKAAIRSGVEVLLREAGISADTIQVFLVAGAFGSYLDLSNAIRIGMFPPIPLDRYQQVGNAAGAGARQMLVSTRQRSASEHLGEKIEYIELTTVPGYSDIFMDAIQLGD
jgi:uncharacterized 2Fe-2S/4Fe-4S cluster protein (DUF4445 family)